MSRKLRPPTGENDVFLPLRELTGNIMEILDSSGRISRPDVVENGAENDKIVAELNKTITALNYLLDALTGRKG